MEVESDILSEVIKCRGFHNRAPKYGERAWKAEWQNVDVIYWDTGNSWCDIMDVIPKKEMGQEETIRFYKRLNNAIAKHYDENGYRID